MGKAIPNLQLFLSLLLLTIVIFGLDNFSLLTLPKQVGFFITNPISFGIYRAKQSLSSQFYFIFASRKAGQENLALKEQLGQLISENAQLKRKLAETEAQVEQEINLSPKTYNMLAARPVGVDRFLKIDKGSLDGVSVGQVVVFKDNYIGQVVTVSEHGASVRLTHDPDSKVAAFSQGKSGRAKGVVKGEFGTEITMDKILHEEPIEPGDLIYTEGTEEALPRGLVIGRVISIDDQQNQVFKKAKVEPLFDLRDLEVVFLIAD